MNKIISLDDNTIKKIAAGEVVERPASVVKELIENSLDAQADKIVVEIEKGGIESIKISDNGIGMSKQDLILATQIHTTSKIQNIDDLNKLITFGFRGEALASIASVSQTIIHSADENESNEVFVENGEMSEVISKPRVRGTTITVNDLFRHLPARKKFLRSEPTEYRNILNEIIKIGLAYPEVGLTLIHNNKTQLQLPQANSKIERIAQIYKGIDPKDLIEINVSTPIARISGHILHPKAVSQDKSKQFLFLNKRFIFEKSLLKAIRDGYGTTLSRDESPAYFINWRLIPHLLI
jgi:DNA mismatch repair protein MutL